MLPRMKYGWNSTIQKELFKTRREGGAMQIGNLNKIINLFVVGFFVNAIIVLFNLYVYPQNDSRLILFLQKFDSEASVVLLLFISIPVALFWGRGGRSADRSLAMGIDACFSPEIG
ncbi:MAG: hypothetical protein Q9P14_04465 [candidate division KSB1 bacterium]|nr:hypothetical protein [candidate division KSB1 bacterium]